MIEVEAIRQEGMTAAIQLAQVQCQAAVVLFTEVRLMVESFLMGVSRPLTWAHTLVTHPIRPTIGAALQDLTRPITST